MVRFAFEDDFGKLMLYPQKFRKPCLLNRFDFNRLCNSLHVTPIAPPIYGQNDDIKFQGDEQVTFKVVDSVCQITIGDRTRNIPNISHLPINDRVLHYCRQKYLGPTEKKVIKAFTRFLRTYRVRLTGPFSCLQNIRTHITRKNMHCEIVADRPIPLHVPSMWRTWYADKLEKLIPSRANGNRLYHFRRGAPDNNEYIRDEFIYAGVDCYTSQPESPLETADAGSVL